jgi:hypothetical protein
MLRKPVLLAAVLWVSIGLGCVPALLAQPSDGPAAPALKITLIQNVRVFIGTGLSGPTNVLVRGNKIEKISSTPVDSGNGSNVTTVDGGRRTLMQGANRRARPSHA